MSSADARTAPHGTGSRRWAGVLGLAAAYLVTGKLGLSLAISPGYATIVWPPSGVALAALLARGTFLWPGVFLGSFANNVHRALDQGTFSFDSAPAYVGIALGATLQALAAVWLTRRSIGFPTLFDQPLKALRFLFLGGPLACLVSATVGCLSLLAVGAVTAADFPFSWWTWWAGDTIGVLTFTPLLLVWLGTPQERHRRRSFSEVTPLLVSLALMLASFLAVRAWDYERLWFRFEQRSRILADAVTSRVGGCLEVLESVGSLYEATPVVTEETFRRFVQPAIDRHPQFASIGWAPRVSAEDRGAFEERLASLHGARAGLTRRSPSGALVRAPERDVHYPVDLVEPDDGSPAVGFDLASAPQAQADLERAREEGLLVTCGGQGFLPATAEATDNRVLVTVPVLDGQGGLRGLVLGDVDLEDLVARAREATEAFAVRLTIVDLEDDAPKRSIYGEIPDEEDEAAADEAWYAWNKRPGETYAYEEVLEVGAGDWKLGFNPSPGFLSGESTSQGWMVLTLGIFFAALLGSSLLLVTGRTRRIQQVVEERTHELERKNDSLRQTSMELEATVSEARRARDAAREASRAKSNFLANMSHELRTPLHSVIGFSRIVLRSSGDRLGAEELEYLRRIQDNGQHLLALIEDVLDLSRIEAGHMSLALEAVDLGGLLEDTVADVGERARAKGVELVGPDAAPLQPLAADRQRLRQVVLNLLDNAVKFTEPGGRVTVSVARDGERPLRLDVTDTGIGIAPEKLGQIFESFRQEDETVSRRFGGTGLGLSIARRLSRLMGFDVHARSRQGEGSTFSVSFTADGRPDEPPRPTPT